ncbi:MAG TPA: hypothetical protein VGC42_01910, partial [Kofleriaceae bacterium]
VPPGMPAPGVIIVPPGNLFEKPRLADATPGPARRTSRPSDAITLPGSGPARVLGSAPAPAVTDSGGVPVVGAAVPAPPAASAASAGRKRRVFWMVLVLAILGVGAMAAAYFLPDLEAMIDQLTSR